VISTPTKVPATRRSWKAERARCSTRGGRGRGVESKVPSPVPEGGGGGGAGGGRGGGSDEEVEEEGGGRDQRRCRQ
jgi:hypothetical protein